MTAVSMATRPSQNDPASTTALDGVELGQEARRERRARLGQQEDGEGEGQQRLAPGQAGVVVERVVAVAPAAERR